MAKAKSRDSNLVYQLKITLANVQPPVWRRVQVKDCSLARLHDIIQISMGWTNSHMHVFDVGGEQYGEDPMGELDWRSARTVKFSQIAAAGHKRFVYTYDMGDNWEHLIQVEKTLSAEKGVRYPHCVAGERACPPEDCGGPWGYEEFLEAIRDPKHEQHEDLLEWIGGEFDPEVFDAHAVNQELRRVR
jgi:hypothetical protein